jgi:hypothetical protein
MLIAAVFAFASTMLLASSQAAEVATKSLWSAPVRGLRARLEFGEEKVINGTRIPEVYIELYNESYSASPMEFDFNFAWLQFDLRTSDNKPAPRPQSTVEDGFRSGPFHIELPDRGTLRFPVTYYGYGIYPGTGMMLGFQTAHWELPRDKADYFLSATLVVPKRPNPRGQPKFWAGTLQIPFISVPARK